MFNRLTAIILIFVTVFSVGGVYATWKYTGGAMDPVSFELPVRLGEFNWAGSEDLPTDDKIGEDHISLIQNIISHSEHGLNVKNGYLNEQIADRKKGSFLGLNGGGNVELVFNGYRVSVKEVEKILEADGGCITT